MTNSSRYKEDSNTMKETNNEEVIEINSDPNSDDEICELEHLRKLFIGGLAPYTTEENLKAFYGQWGKVVDVVVMRDPNTKRSRGFGFITYTKSSCVNTAQDNRPHIIDGKTVEAKRALPRPERENRETNISVKKLFVGGLKDNHDEECLKEYFSQFGNVVSIKILTDKTTGKRRGFAFIEFDDYDAVDKAILHKQHSIKYVIVDVKKSVYKQEQQNRQQNHSENGVNDGSSNNYGNQNRMQGKPGNMPPTPAPPHGHQMPPAQHAMPYQQPPPPMNGCPPGPPPNYNYWGPPPVQQPYGNAYQQPPPPAPMNNWNYPPAPNAWNSGPPQAPVPGNWQTNQWGYPPAGPPPPPPGANTWNAPPAPVQQVPPPGTPNSVPPPQQVQPPQVPPPATAPAPPNFGAGYQQSYGGGPVKHNGTNGSRMNPYSAPPTNNYASNGQNNAPPSYGGYSAPAPQPKTAQTAAPVPPVGSKYRR